MTRTVTVVHVLSKKAQAKLVEQLQPIQAAAEKPNDQPAGKPNPLATAMHHLGSRFGERGDTFYLDGRPVNLADVMRETNRLRAGQGLPQLDANPSWVVHG